MGPSTEPWVRVGLHHTTGKMRRIHNPEQRQPAPYRQDMTWKTREQHPWLYCGRVYKLTESQVKVIPEVIVVKMCNKLWEMFGTINRLTCDYKDSLFHPDQTNMVDWELRKNPTNYLLTYLVLKPTYVSSLIRMWLHISRPVRRFSWVAFTFTSYM